MISSLPDRPLSPAEAVNTSKRNSGFLMLPAIPISMFEGDQVTDVRDLLIVTENVLTVLAYEEADGWVSVARFNNTTKFSEAVAAIIDDLEQRIDELTEFSPSSEFSARGPE